MCNLINDPNFGFLLGKSHFLLTSEINKALHDAGLDLTKEQYLVLKLLWQNQAINQQEISIRLHKDKYNITKLVDGLERRKLVIRIVDQKDRRMKFIHLTEEGKTIKEKAENVVNTIFEQMKTGIEDNDLKVAQNVLLQFIQNMQERREERD